MSETTILQIPEESILPEIPDSLPLLASDQFVLFPFMIAPLLIQDEGALRMVDDVIGDKRMIGVFARRDLAPGDGVTRAGQEPTYFERLHPVGCAAMILRMLKIPDGTIRLLVHGVRRIRLIEPLGTVPYPQARIEPIDEIPPEEREGLALMKNARDLLGSLVELSDSLTDELMVAANNTPDPGRLADLIASSLSFKIDEQQQILTEANVHKRLIALQQIMHRELELAKLGSKIQTQVRSNLERHQRDYFLREQLKAIRRELGEEAEAGAELDELADQIDKASLSEAARKVADKELSRLRSMSPASAEYTVSRTYLDWIVSLPWNKRTADNIDLKHARTILDRDHFDLDKIKERILDYLAVIKLRKAIRGPILCLVGPPGVGKTSLGRSIAESMGRQFVRMSLGGMRDEAEIRGHRRTYIGSLPGRIIKSLKDADACNPVMMLDEIDKLGADFRGDPASALLEVLDPEQNYHFVDHYLDLPFDLSEVMFITTANTLETVPGPLRDRMEVIPLSGYTLNEKLEIAQRYLVPRALENTGLRPRQAQFDAKALTWLIENYTREAGLRNLEREITNLCRKVARRVAEGSKTRTTRVNLKFIAESLGPERFDLDVVDERAGQPGVAVGLAWTPTGGDILFIEATATPSTTDGAGRLLLTGQLGEVMKESAQAARTCLLARTAELGLPATAFDHKDLHVHVPAGAIPKDGPSAGIALMTAMASLLLNRAPIGYLAMTGEITIKGNVLPVGGIKEKVLAAHRSGIRTLILPERNEKDLIDVPEEVRNALTIHAVTRIEQVLELAFPAPPKKSARKTGKSAPAPRRSRTRRAPRAKG